MGTGGEKLGGINVHILLPQLAQFAIEQYQEQQDRKLGEYHDRHGQECSLVDSFIRCTNCGRKASVVCEGGWVGGCVCVCGGGGGGGGESERCTTGEGYSSTNLL